MANRRFGVSSSNKGGGGYSSQGGYHQSNKMSPWQGGAAPGNAGLLSSFTGPQAQLALALSSLLQAPNNPPSLLSLNTQGSGHQDYGLQGRFDRGRDFRRPEPYKNQARFGPSWRDSSTRPLGGGGGGPQIHRSGGGNRPNYQKGGGKFNRGKNQGGKPKDKQYDPVKKDTKNEGENNVSHDESREEDSAKKRDWKREKKEETAEKSNESVDLTADDEEAKENSDEKKNRDKSGRYKGVPASLLHCFVCSKSMWDGESFQNHLKGKAHKQMIDSLGQSFQVTVNILRENMRLCEEKKMIEYDRMNRSNRYRHRASTNEPKSHCNMCDLEFFGKIVAHRKTEGHQRLKRFLHPNCDHCEQEFPSRMEWLDHRLTPDHLRKVKEVLDSLEDDEDGAQLEDEPVEMDNEPILDESVQAEAEDPVMELTDDLHDLHNRIPAYKPNRPISKQSLQPKSGFYCDICVRFLVNDERANDHLRSERHYTQFVEAAKSKFQRANEEKERSLKRKQEEEEEEEEANKAESAKKAKVEVKEENGEDASQDNGDKYDPEEPSQDESALDSTALDEEMAEVDSLIKLANESQTETDGAEAEEPESTVESSPRPKRAAAVKNGAGPKSRVARRGK